MKGSNENAKKLEVPANTPPINKEQLNGKPMDIMTDFDEKPEANSLSLLKIGKDQEAFMPFTRQAVEVIVHYAKQPEIRGYFLCNRDDCYYCKIGRESKKRILIPVYHPGSSSITILPVSDSLRPHALLPQLRNILGSNKRFVVFAYFQDYKYHLSTKELTEDMACGEEVIKAFLDAQKGEELQLPTMYQSISNDELADIPEIALLLRLKGIIE